MKGFIISFFFFEPVLGFVGLLHPLINENCLYTFLIVPWTFSCIFQLTVYFSSKKFKWETPNLVD